jgi:hypothetical protein
MESMLFVLPCLNAADQLRFYTSIGFDIIAVSQGNKKNKDIIVKYENILLQFYTRKNAPVHTSVKYLPSDHIEQLYETFTGTLQKNGQAVPRAGIPRITEIEGPPEDRHFTIADPGGNVFVVMAENTAPETF